MIKGQILLLWNTGKLQLFIKAKWCICIYIKTRVCVWGQEGDNGGFLGTTFAFQSMRVLLSLIFLILFFFHLKLNPGLYILPMSKLVFIFPESTWYFILKCTGKGYIILSFASFCWYFTKLLGLEGTSADIWSNPLSRQGHHEQMTQEHIQEGFQRRRLHALPGQLQWSATLNVKKFFLFLRWNLLFS